MEASEGTVAVRSTAGLAEYAYRIEIETFLTRNPRTAYNDSSDTRHAKR